MIATVLFGRGRVSQGLILDAGMALNISHKQDSVLTNNRSMLTLKVLGGPATGSTRMVIGWDPSTRTLTLETPVSLCLCTNHVKLILS